MTLYPHQQRFIDANPNKALLVWDTGTGKSLAAILYIKKRPTVLFVVIVPKNIRGKWEDDLKKHDVRNADVLTKEEYKKKNTAQYQGMVFDEADYAGSPLFVQGRSQLAEKTYYDTQRMDHVLLLTATPLRNAPHTCHTLLTYIQKAPAWKVYQEKQYTLVKRPYLPRPAWEPAKGWRPRAVGLLRKTADIVSMSDIVTVPEQHTIAVEVPTIVDMPITEVTAIAQWHVEARAESGKEKLAWIRQHMNGIRKVILVSRYVDTLHTYAKELAKDREVFIVTGQIKDQEATIKAARESFECYLLVQADIGAGWEAPEFSHMVFINLSFSHRSFVQMKGRINRINHLKTNYYYILNGYEKDKSVWKRIEAAEDYQITTPVKKA